MTLRISGVVNSLPMFFDNKDRPDFDSLLRYLELLESVGEPRLIYPMAYNTRVAYLNEKELYRVHEIVQLFCRRAKCKWIAVPPYKASERQLNKFLDNLPVDENLYGISMLFPERFYLAADVFCYFSIPNRFGLKTVAHEMKLVRGQDGGLIDWPVDVLLGLPKYCDLAAIKEDSKNDDISKISLADRSYDVFLAGGGLTQVDRLISHAPTAWLAGVSLVEPRITKYEHLLINAHAERRHFVRNVETPFFDLCSRFGWHRVHKALLASLHGFPKFEPKPMGLLATAEHALVEEVWSSVISPEILRFENLKTFPCEIYHE